MIEKAQREAFADIPNKLEKVDRYSVSWDDLSKALFDDDICIYIYK